MILPLITESIINSARKQVVNDYKRDKQRRRRRREKKFECKENARENIGGKERNEALEYTCLNRYEEEERELGEEEYEFTRHNTHEGLDSYITLAN